MYKYPISKDTLRALARYLTTDGHPWKLISNDSMGCERHLFDDVWFQHLPELKFYIVSKKRQYNVIELELIIEEWLLKHA